MDSKQQSGFIEIYLIIAIALVLSLSGYLWQHIYSIRKIDSLQINKISSANNNTGNNFVSTISDFKTEKNLNIISNHKTTIKSHSKVLGPIISTPKILPSLNWKNFNNFQKTKLANNINLSLQSSLLNEADLYINKLELNSIDKEIFLISLGNSHIKELNLNQTTTDDKILHIITVGSIIIDNIILSNNTLKILIYSATGDIEIKGYIEKKICNIYPYATVLLRAKKLVVNSVELNKSTIWTCKNKELFKIFPEHRIIGYQG